MKKKHTQKGSSKSELERKKKRTEMHLHHYLVEREWDERIQVVWMESIFKGTLQA